MGLPGNTRTLLPLKVAVPAFVRIEVRHPDGHMAALSNPVIMT